MGNRCTTRHKTAASSTRNPPPTHPTRPTHPFFLVPLEIRLEIYTKCTTLSLLQLSHANAFLRAEINRYPSIIRSTDEFDDVADVLNGDLFTRPDGTPGKFHIGMVACLKDVGEVPLFREIYSGFPRGLDPDVDIIPAGKIYYVCGRCTWIKKHTSFVPGATMPPLAQSQRKICSLCTSDQCTRGFNIKRRNARVASRKKGWYKGYLDSTV